MSIQCFCQKQILENLEAATDLPADPENITYIAAMSEQRQQVPRSRQEDEGTGTKLTCADPRIQVLSSRDSPVPSASTSRGVQLTRHLSAERKRLLRQYYNVEASASNSHNRKQQSTQDDNSDSASSDDENSDKEDLVALLLMAESLPPRLPPEPALAAKDHPALSNEACEASRKNQKVFLAVQDQQHQSELQQLIHCDAKPLPCSGSTSVLPCEYVDFGLIRSKDNTTVTDDYVADGVIDRNNSDSNDRTSNNTEGLVFNSTASHNETILEHSFDLDSPREVQNTQNDNDWVVQRMRGRYDDGNDDETLPTPPALMVECPISSVAASFCKESNSSASKTDCGKVKEGVNYSADVQKRCDSGSDDDEQKITILTPSKWNQQFADHPYHNRMGVVHVQVKQARRLPCPVRSQVQLVLRLNPWKGKVKVKETAVAFAGPGGVQVQFGTNNYNNDAPITSLLHNYAGEEDVVMNGNETTIPEIQIDLVFQPLSVTLLEFVMCSFRISCRPLLQHPNTPVSAWLQSNGDDPNQCAWIELEAMFQPSASSEHVDCSDEETDIQDDDDSDHGGDYVVQDGASVASGSELAERHSYTPCTFDDDNYDESHFDRRKDDLVDEHETIMDETTTCTYEKVASNGDDFQAKANEQRQDVHDTLITHITLPASATKQHKSYRPKSSASVSSKSSVQSVSSIKIGRGENSSVDSLSGLSWQSNLHRTAGPMHKKFQLHLLRLTTFRRPAYCCVCGQNITTVLWKTIALHCEACGVDCCDDCRLQVDLHLPCMSEGAKLAVSAVFQNKVTMDNLMHALAPFDYENDKSQAAIDDLSRRSTTTAARSDSKVSLRLINTENKTHPSPCNLQAPHHRGVGTMKFDFLRAHVLDEAVPAETDPATLLDRRVRPGEYYVRVAWTGDTKTVRTRTIQSNGRPKLESGLMQFVVYVCCWCSIVFAQVEV